MHSAAAAVVKDQPGNCSLMVLGYQQQAIHVSAAAGGQLSNCNLVVQLQAIHAAVREQLGKWMLLPGRHVQTSDKAGTVERGEDNAIIILMKPKNVWTFVLQCELIKYVSWSWNNSWSNSIIPKKGKKALSWGDICPLFKQSTVFCSGDQVSSQNTCSAPHTNKKKMTKANTAMKKQQKN